MEVIKRVESRPIEVGLIPLINIVFLLLVFFMIAGVIRPADRLQVIPATSESGETVTQTDLPVLLDAQGRVAVGGQVFTDLTAFRVWLMNNSGNIVINRIRSDQAVSVGQLRRMLDILRLAGVEQVSLETRLP